jgi:hypothetical protein
MWPVIDLTEVTGILYAYLPKKIFIASVSVLSPSGVEVPWALIKRISSALNPASSIAALMASASPSGDGFIW